MSQIVGEEDKRSPETGRFVGSKITELSVSTLHSLDKLDVKYPSYMAKIAISSFIVIIPTRVERGYKRSRALPRYMIALPRS